MTEQTQARIENIFSSIYDDLKHVSRIFSSSMERFYWEDGFSKAASLAYASLFALVPFTTLLVALLTSFGSSVSYLPELQNFIFHQFIPNSIDSKQMLEYINRFSVSLSSLNIISIPFLVITSILLLNSVEYALNKVWQVYEPRTIAHRISIFCAILVLMPILAVSAYYTTQFSIEPFINTFSMPVDRVVKVYRLILAGIIDFAVFTSLYYLVPKANVLFRSAALGGLFSALFFNFAKNQFAFYVATFTSYEKIYGTLAAIPLFFLWLYLAWVIVLFGAEISFQAQFLPRTGKIWQRTLMSVGDGRFVLAIQALVSITQAYERAEQLPNEIDLSEKLGCSSIVLKSILEDLKKADIIARSDSRDMPLTLKRSPEKILVNDIIQAISPQNNFDRFTGELIDTFSSIRDAKNRSLSSIVSGKQ